MVLIRHDDMKVYFLVNGGGCQDRDETLFRGSGDLRSAAATRMG
jgi:hypothetical protein